jgi:hypothetical protein
MFQYVDILLLSHSLNLSNSLFLQIKNCVIQFLNLISNTYDEKNVFWTKTLRSHIFSRFGQVALRKEESIRPQLSLKRLIHRLASDCGIVLNLNEEITCSFEFTRSDIVKIEPIFRAMHTTAHAEGQLYSMLAMKRERQQRDPGTLLFFSLYSSFNSFTLKITTYVHRNCQEAFSKFDPSFGEGSEAVSW